jgi:SAM-dependent methyltransferase
VVANLVCQLCGGACRPFHSDRRREYWRCQTCLLVQVPPAWHLPPSAEQAIYDLHENQLEDPGYQRFLSRMAEPLAERVPTGAEGLDFGCGPAPALAAMLGRKGLKVSLYDLYYHPDANVFARCWDFITATEVVEHLARPGEELERLWKCLRPGGWLGIMTKRVIDADAFSRWHYKNDMTHISFFSDATFTWLANHWNAELHSAGADVVLLRKPLSREPDAIP